mmetsp:Transcript_7081/g.12654  ORF Transcript_7081/g.12654 Transcript_7081/m.12654 type:complete len:241 (+) Transcript_7081:2990-3712(+)
MSLLRRMPTVQNSMLPSFILGGLASFRTVYPTDSPIDSPRSHATRSATEMAAIRRGCVTITRGRRFLPSSRPTQSSTMNCGSCVLFPLPVPPLTTSALSSLRILAKGCLRLLTGSNGTPLARFAFSRGSWLPSPFGGTYLSGTTSQAPADKSGAIATCAQRAARCWDQSCRRAFSSRSRSSLPCSACQRPFEISQGRSSNSIGVTTMRRSHSATSPPPNREVSRARASSHAAAMASRRLH